MIQAIFQPEIRAKVFTLLGKSFYRMVSPAKAIILTDCELIAIREEEKACGAGRYGGIWDYLPLNKIRNVSLRERDGGLLALSVELPEEPPAGISIPGRRRRGRWNRCWIGSGN